MLCSRRLAVSNAMQHTCPVLGFAVRTTSLLSEIALQRSTQ